MTTINLTNGFEELEITVNSVYLDSDSIKLTDFCVDFSQAEKVTPFRAFALKVMDKPVTLSDIKGIDMGACKYTISKNGEIVFSTIVDAYDFAVYGIECFANHGDGCLEIYSAITGETIVIC